MADERRPVVRTRAARRDLEAFVRYLTREAGERTAECFVAAYEQRIDILARFPGLGEPLEAPAHHPMTIRYSPVGGRFRGHVLVYGLRDECVVILRLVRAERDLAALLSQGREPAPADDGEDEDRDDVEPLPR